MTPQQYDKLLTGSITKTYKISEKDAVLQVNREAKDIAKSLKLDDRIEGYAEKSAFIILKDHKGSFQSNPKCRLINLAKSKIGKISKKILDDINSELRKKTELIQWRNTSEVINWFKGLNIKNKHCFLEFDKVDFYPSITEELLLNALKFAKYFIDISPKYEDIIMQDFPNFLVPRTHFRESSLPRTPLLSCVNFSPNCYKSIKCKTKINCA